MKRDNVNSLCLCAHLRHGCALHVCVPAGPSMPWLVLCALGLSGLMFQSRNKLDMYIAALNCSVR